MHLRGRRDDAVQALVWSGLAWLAGLGWPKARPSGRLTATVRMTIKPDKVKSRERERPGEIETSHHIVFLCLFSASPPTMEFFKSAVASAISKGPPFPYTFGDKVDVDTSIWTLYNGTKRVNSLQLNSCSSTNNVPQEDGSNCSILSFDVPANKSRLPMARNAVKKLRTLRHPGVIKVLDTVEV